MLLCIDTGNTSTTCGVFSLESPRPLYVFRFSGTEHTTVGLISAEIARQLALLEISPSIITAAAHVSVRPSLFAAYIGAVNDLFGINLYSISHGSRINFSIMYDDKTALGLDRIVNIEAAVTEKHESCIIIDIGTAVTFCTVVEKTFIGGMIAPGIGITIRALAEAAENLPVITFQKPRQILGRNTQEGLQSGFFYGWISLIEGVISRICRDIQKDLPVILTGGYSRLLHTELSGTIEYDPDLTLRGIYYIFKSNNKAL